jgi:DNA-binding transcriptional MerR regulator
MQEFLLSADVARILAVTPATVRDAARAGSLPVAATTPSGLRLFTRADAERLRRERSSRAAKSIPPKPAA